MTSPLRVIATIPIDPAHVAEAGPALAELAASSRGDQGFLAYEVYESGAVPGLFVTVEEWESQADLDAHMGQPHIGKAFGVIGAHLSGEVAIHPLNPV